MSSRTATILGLDRLLAGTTQTSTAANLTNIKCAVIDPSWPRSGIVHAYATVSTNLQGDVVLAGLPLTTPSSARAIMLLDDNGTEYSAFVPITTNVV